MEQIKFESKTVVGSIIGFILLILVVLQTVFGFGFGLFPAEAEVQQVVENQGYSVVEINKVKLEGIPCEDDESEWEVKALDRDSEEVLLTVCAPNTPKMLIGDEDYQVYPS